MTMVDMQQHSIMEILLTVSATDLSGRVYLKYGLYTNLRIWFKWEAIIFRDA